MTPRENKIRFWTGLAVLLIFLAGAQFRFEGFTHRSLHPDEATIANWTEQTADGSAIHERLYPGGAFTLARPFYNLAQILVEPKTGTTGTPARHVNALLFFRAFKLALSLLVMGLVTGIVFILTRKAAPVLAAAAWAAFDPIFIEHTHYAETDIALLFGATLALFCWVQALRGRRAGWLLGGAFMAGFTMGTKYSLAPLLVVPILLPFVFYTGESGGERPWKTGLLVLASLLLALAGFIVAEPAVRDPIRFFNGLHEQSARVFGEQHAIMRSIADDAWAVRYYKCRSLALLFRDMGLPFVILVIAGAWTALRSAPLRRMAWPVVLIPALYAGAAAGCFPFIREQEYLQLLPYLVILAVLPLAWPGAPSGWARARRLIPLLLTIAGLWQWHLDARRMAMNFRWPDPREWARDWIDRHLPDSDLLAVDNLSRLEGRNSPVFLRPYHNRLPLSRPEGSTVFLRKKRDAGLRRELNGRTCDYLLASLNGEPDLSGEPLPPAAPVPVLTWGAFFYSYPHSRGAQAGSGQRVKGVKPYVSASQRSPRPNADHHGLAVTLYALAAPPLPDGPREVVAAPEGPLYRFDTPPLLGPVYRVPLTALPRDILSGGTTQPCSRITLLFKAGAAPASLRVRLWGRTHAFTLPPGREESKCFTRPWWWRVAEPYTHIQVWSATPAAEASLLLNPPEPDAHSDSSRL
jgi:hypothetical protein